MKKWLYLGVDQTGAVDRNGKPRPLPACLIKNKTVSFFYLLQFSKNEIEKHVEPKKNEDLIVCVDCVLGLPRELGLTWREALKRIKDFDGYGMAVARQFFKDIGQGSVPRRQIEIQCKANSVFKEKPFQKNIQTGTFRIWKDISLDENSFLAPALEKQLNSHQLKIFEGYPSLSWRLLFEIRTRKPDEILKLLKKWFPEIEISKTQRLVLAKDPNLADALVLALTIRKLRQAAFGLNPSIEGSILGAIT